jgi:predicted nucleotidyltransferase
MKDPRKLAEEFLDALKRALGSRLQAATLFGSAARGEWIDGVSDVNILVLLDNIEAHTLLEVAPLIRGSLEAGVAPLPVESVEWSLAADVFPIELSDMKDASVPLEGNAVAPSLTIDASALRLQAERELRAKLIQMHAGMLAVGRDPKQLGELLMSALPSVTTYLRAALRLAGRPVPRSSTEVIAEGCRLTDADPAPFLRVLGARSAWKLQVPLQDPLSDQFNASTERMAAFIDAFGRNTK